MMKKVSVIVTLVFIALQAVYGQSAPLGKDLVRQFSERMQTYKTIESEFSFTLENLQEGFSDTHEGELLLKGKKYNLNVMGMEVYFDGETKWQFIPEANEVTISKPTGLDGGFFDDPTQIFRDYEEDFKSRFVGEKVVRRETYYEVDLYPEDLSAPYSIIKITFKKQNLEPVSIKYTGKDGVNYIIEIKDFNPNVTADDSKFTFNTSDYKDIMIVDLR